MNPLQSIQSMLPFTGPPESRTPAQIDCDLEDEFAFHLEMKTRDLIEQGVDRTVAGDMAKAIFGDINAIKTTCKRIALKEHVMLQRINFVMMILVLVVVGIVGFQMFATQKYNTLALQAITTELTNMKYSALAEQRTGAATTGDGHAQESSIAAGPEVARILVEGNVANPGWHEISLTTGTTLKDMLLRLGVQFHQWVVHKKGGTATSSPRPRSDYLDSKEAIILRPNDELVILDAVSSEIRRGYFSDAFRQGQLPRCWTARDAQGNVYHLGTTQVEINARTQHRSTFLVQEGARNNWGLGLQTGYLQVSEMLTAWDYHNGRVTLDFSEVRPRRGGSHISIEQNYLIQSLVGKVLTFAPADCEQFDHALLVSSIAQVIDRVAREALSAALSWDLLFEKPNQIAITNEVLAKEIKHIEIQIETRTNSAEVAQPARELLQKHLARLHTDPRWGLDADFKSRAAVMREFAMWLVEAATPTPPIPTPLEAINHLEKLSPAETTSNPELTRRIFSSAREYFAAKVDGEQDAAP